MAGEIKALQFIEGTDVTPPTLAPLEVGDPVGDDDAMSKGWFEEYGNNREAVHAGVGNKTTLKALTSRADKQVILVENLNLLYRYDSTATDVADDDDIIEPDDSTGRFIKIGSGTGSASGQFDGPLAYEKIDGATNPKAVFLAKIPTIKIPEADSYIDLNEGGGEINIKVLSTDQSFITSDMSGSLDSHDILNVIVAALNDSVDTTLTYWASYFADYVTLNASATCSFLWNSGTNTGHSIASYLGFEVTSDDTGSNQYTADNISADASGYYEPAWVALCDGDDSNMSSSFKGFVDEDLDKGDLATVKNNLVVSFDDNLTECSDYYTQGSTITLTSANNVIYFKEGVGGSLSPTVATGSYTIGSPIEANGYISLCAAIKAAMEGAGALTYDVVYNRATNKITISTASNFTLEFSNTTNTIASEIGFASIDTTSDVSHLADNQIDLAGNIIEEDSAPADSVYTGTSLETTAKLFAARDYSISAYSTYLDGRGISIPSGVYNYWPTRGHTSGNIVDFMGNFNLVETNGSPTYDTTDKFLSNNAITGFSTNKALQTASDATAYKDGDLTSDCIELWFKVGSLATSGYIGGKGTTSEGYDIRYYQTSDKIEIGRSVVALGGATTTTLMTNINDDQWHYLVTNRTKSGSDYLYDIWLDNVKEVSAWSRSYSMTGNYCVVFGNKVGASVPMPTGWKICEMAFWRNATASAAQISARWNNGNGVRYV